MKADVVRRHLAGKVPVSELAAEWDIQPSLIHLWVKQVLDQAEKAFARGKHAATSRAENAKARRQVSSHVTHYNHVRLHLSIGYVAPADKLNGLAPAIHAARNRKLEEARSHRQAARAKAARDCLTDCQPLQPTPA